MPIVDGFTSTKLIRSYEKTEASHCLSRRAQRNNRIPIFAVSASLVESEREKYLQCGFDGWILKPVDFKRVDTFLKGLVDPEQRDNCVYESGKWEQGGWFHKFPTPEDIFTSKTSPDEDAPVSQPASASVDTTPTGVQKASTL